MCDERTERQTDTPPIPMSLSNTAECSKMLCCIHNRTHHRYSAENWPTKTCGNW